MKIYYLFNGELMYEIKHNNINVVRSNSDSHEMFEIRSKTMTEDDINNRDLVPDNFIYTDDSKILYADIRPYYNFIYVGHKEKISFYINIPHTFVIGRLKHGRVNTDKYYFLKCGGNDIPFKDDKYIVYPYGNHWIPGSACQGTVRATMTGKNWLDSYKNQDLQTNTIYSTKINQYNIDKYIDLLIDCIQINPTNDKSSYFELKDDENKYGILYRTLFMMPDEYNLYKMNCEKKEKIYKRLIGYSLLTYNKRPAFCSLALNILAILSGEYAAKKPDYEFTWERLVSQI